MTTERRTYTEEFKREAVRLPETEWETLSPGPNERDLLQADFARYRVWVVSPEGIIREETF